MNKIRKSVLGCALTRILFITIGMALLISAALPPGSWAEETSGEGDPSADIQGGFDELRGMNDEELENFKGSKSSTEYTPGSSARSNADDSSDASPNSRGHVTRSIESRGLRSSNLRSGARKSESPTAGGGASGSSGGSKTFGSGSAGLSSGIPTGGGRSSSRSESSSDKHPAGERCRIPAAKHDPSLTFEKCLTLTHMDEDTYNYCANAVKECLYGVTLPPNYDKAGRNPLTLSWDTFDVNRNPVSTYVGSIWENIPLYRIIQFIEETQNPDTEVINISEFWRESKGRREQLWIFRRYGVKDGKATYDRFADPLAFFPEDYLKDVELPEGFSILDIFPRFGEPLLEWCLYSDFLHPDAVKRCYDRFFAQDPMTSDLDYESVLEDEGRIINGAFYKFLLFNNIPLAALNSDIGDLLWELRPWENQVPETGLIDASPYYLTFFNKYANGPPPADAIGGYVSGFYFSALPGLRQYQVPGSPIWSQWSLLSNLAKITRTFDDGFTFEFGFTTPSDPPVIADIDSPSGPGPGGIDYSFCSYSLGKRTSLEAARWCAEEFLIRTNLDPDYIWATAPFIAPDWDEFQTMEVYLELVYTQSSFYQRLLAGDLTLAQVMDDFAAIDPSTLDWIRWIFEFDMLTDPGLFLEYLDPLGELDGEFAGYPELLQDWYETYLVAPPLVAFIPPEIELIDVDRDAVAFIPPEIELIDVDRDAVAFIPPVSGLIGVDRDAVAFIPPVSGLIGVDRDAVAFIPPESALIDVNGDPFAFIPPDISEKPDIFLRPPGPDTTKESLDSFRTSFENIRSLPEQDKMKFGEDFFEDAEYWIDEDGAERPRGEDAATTDSGMPSLDDFFFYYNMRSGHSGLKTRKGTARKKSKRLPKRMRIPTKAFLGG